MPTPARLRLVTVLIVAAALTFAGSMFLPISASDRYEPGYVLAWLSVIGTGEGIPVCALGLLGNCLFLAGWIVILVRRAAWPTERGGLAGILVGSLAAGAMVISWLWMAGTMGNPSGMFSSGSGSGGDSFLSALTPASIAWLASGLLLATAGALSRVRTGGPIVPGFEVVNAHRPQA